MKEIDPQQRFYDPVWWEETIDRGIPLSFRYVELPLEELLTIDELSKSLYPGLRFNLRKQRGEQYILTMLPTKHLTKERDEVKGEP